MFVIVRFAIIISALLFTDRRLNAQGYAPDTVVVQSGNLRLKGLLWKPDGTGSFPAIIFCHGSLGGIDTIHDPLREASLLGNVFANRGYIFFALFRRGAGLSKNEGVNSTDLMDNAFKEKGQEERNKVQLQQLETDQLKDMISGMKFLKSQRNTDTNHVAIIGHSFGGSLALLLAEHERNVKAVVVFSPAGYSWNLSPPLRERLLTAIKNIAMPVMIIHAQNDYSVNPGFTLDSMMNQLHKTHVLKIYPKFGNSASEGHGLIFQGTKIWEADVFKFLDEYMKY
ncbi:MAG TPA: alpha/beta fold hydrolase [Chitinophagaceae bacterium]